MGCRSEKMQECDHPSNYLGSISILPEDAARRQQLLLRDKLLVMCGILAAQLELPTVANYCRSEILHNNPGHMVRRWENFEIALKDADFCHFLKQIQRRFSLETAERMLDEAGIELGAKERESYYTDEEYAAALLGVTLDDLHREN